MIQLLPKIVGSSIGVSGYTQYELSSMLHAVDILLIE